MTVRVFTTISLLALVASQATAGTMKRMFSEDDVSRTVQFWSQPGRYQVAPPLNVQQQGLWQVRLTPEGSTWLRKYSSARGLGKTPPNLTVGAQNTTQVAWEQWLTAKVAYDRAQAALAARKLNVEQVGREVPSLAAVTDPGPVPVELANLVGTPPPFAEAASPKLHTVIFEDGQRYAWHDHPDMRPRYEYYRFREGVMDGGTPMRTLTGFEVSELLTRAGIDGSARKVFASVSLLEGGFDSINTYDTGFVSVGFIQFACLTAGAGSLGQVMLRQKQDDPVSFDRDFKKYGLDVTPGGVICALDLETQQERQGAEAARQIILDKRLIAVFQRAGRVSAANRVAQLAVAKSEYYPVNDSLLIPVDGRVLSGKVGQIFRSEAGLATLMDRKVNTGKLDPILTVLQRVARENKLERFEQFADHERQIVGLMRWRKNYLEDSTLTQPAQKPDTNSQSQPSFPPKTPR